MREEYRDNKIGSTFEGKNYRLLSKLKEPDFLKSS